MNPKNQSPGAPARKHSPKPAFSSGRGALGWFIGLGLASVGLGAIVWVYVMVPKNQTTGQKPGPTEPFPPAIGLATNSAASADHTNTGPAAAINTAQHSENEGNGTDSEKAVELLQIGNRLLAEGKLNEAIEHFRHSLVHDPGSEDTHYNLAIALAQAGKIDEAIKSYEEALKILPDYAEAHNNLGNLLVKQNKYDLAIEHFTQSLQANPDSASAENNLGNALARQGKVAEATVHFAKAVYLQPNYVDAHYNLGNAYAVQGRLDEAIAEFTAALRYQPSFTPAINALSKAQQKKALTQK